MNLPLILLLSYALWVIVYLVYYIKTLKGQLKKHPQKTITGSDSLTQRHHYQSQITPNDVKQNQVKPMTENANTFAPETKNGQGQSAQIPSEQMDEAFTNEPFEIDVETTYETAEDIDLIDDSAVDFARGVSFDEISSAIDTAQSTAADKMQELNAGRALAEIENTEICEQIRNCSKAIAARVTELIAKFQNETEFPKPLLATQGNFDINNYI